MTQSPENEPGHGTQQPNDVAQVVRDLVAAHFKVPAASLTSATRFREDLCADSLDLVLLVHEFEDRLRVVVAQEDFPRVRTLGDAVDVATRSPPG